MKSNSSNTLTFRSILSSYILVCAVLLGISGIGYAGFIWNMRNEQERFASLQVQELARQVSDNIQKAYRMFDILEMEKEFWEIAQLKGPFQPEEIYRATELKTVMAGMDAKDDLYRNLHIYFCRSNSILSSQSQRREGDRDIAFFCSQYDMDKNTFDRIMSMEAGKYYMVTGGNRILFFQPVYQDEELLAVIFAEYDGNSLIGREVYENNVMLRTEEGENLLCAGDLSKEEIASFAVSQKEAEETAQKTEIAGQAYIGIPAEIGLFNLKLYLLLPWSMFWSQIRRFLFIMLLELFFMAGVAVLLSWFLSKKMYIPVGNLIQDNHKLNKRMLKHNRILENLDLIRYLNGITTVFPRSCAAVKEKLLVDGQEHYQIAVLSLEKRENSFLPRVGTGQGQEEDGELGLLVVWNVLEKYVFSEYPGLVLPVGKQYVVIVALRKMQEAPDGHIKALFQKASEFFAETLKLPICIMIGKEECGFDHMKEVCDSLSEGMQYLDFWSAYGEHKAGVYVYGEMIQDDGDFHFAEYINGSRRLLNCLESGDFRGANRELDQLYKKTFPKNQKYLKYNIYRMYGLIGILITTLHISADEEEEEFYRSINYEERLFCVQSLHELMEESHAIFEQIIGHKENNATEKKPDWLEELLDFIHMHSADMDLNVSALADRFQISVPHLSRSFKTWMGMGALEYIHRAKLKQAKEMLKNDCSVKIAASKVGYTDVQALTRAFKRYEGITPSQYKELVQKNEV